MNQNTNLVLEIKGLCKQFKGVQAVSDITLNIEKGQIYGLLGPNGSGKTTTLAMLLGILHPSKGSFSWFNNGSLAENRLRIGALLETPNFLPYLNAFDNLMVVATIKRVKQPEERIRQVLERVDLLERGNRPFKTYSLGMKQRLAVASALLSDPEVLVLDEPTNGLDPMGIIDMRDLILSIAQEGKTIIIASHILDEIEKICSHVAILKNGKLLFNGAMEEVLKQSRRYLIRSENLDELHGVIRSLLDLQIHDSPEENYLLVESGSNISGSQLNKMLVEKGVYLSELREYKKSLETIFIETVK